MKEERILEILGMVDEKYVEEAAPTVKQRLHYGWTKWALTAACVIGISWFGLSQFGVKKMMNDSQNISTIPINTETEDELWMPTSPPGIDYTTVEPSPTPDAETPEPTPALSTTTQQPDEEQVKDGLLVLTAQLNDLGEGSAGGLMAYDTSEGDRANPWTKEADFTTLPVYKNLAYGMGSGEAVYFEKEELLVKAEDVAAALGTGIQSVEYATVADHTANADTMPGGDAVCGLTAVTDVGEIRVEGNGSVLILLNGTTPLRDLPEEYLFADESTTEEAQGALGYLLEKFKNLHGMEEPVLNCSLDRAFDGDPNRRYTAYDGNGDLLEQILNYNFSTIGFEPGLEFIAKEAGKLTSIGYGNLLDAAEMVGDYPVIPWESAKELLLNGNYITAEDRSYLEDGMVKEEYIAKVELVYITGRLEQYYIPYYKFYVELTQLDGIQMAEGLKWYGAFYVPAVSGEYLTNFPVWKGSYN